MNPIEQINTAILWVLELRGPTLMAILLLALGYVARFLPWIANRYIPGIVILAGPLMAPLFIPLSNPGTVDNGIPWPEFTIWAELVARGLLIGLGVWLSHEFLISKLEDKLKVLAPKSPPVISPLPNATDGSKPAA